jgi:hypothetical protein
MLSKSKFVPFTTTFNFLPSLQSWNLIYHRPINAKYVIIQNININKYIYIYNKLILINVNILIYTINTDILIYINIFLIYINILLIVLT